MAKVEPNLGWRVNSAGYGGLEYAGASLSFPTVLYVYEASAYSKRFETNSRYTEYETPATSGFRFNLELYGAFGPRMR